jgi:hypothetical protein
MPTGYTAKLYDGEQVTFPDFVMQCARAFGALIDMRDEPMDAPVPEEFEPSPFYREQHEAAKARIAEVSAWDDATADQQAQAAYDREVAEVAEHDAKARERKACYGAMLAQVQAWQPPTPDHAGLKDFMTDQLEKSIDIDAKEWREYSFWDAPERLSGTAYRQRELESARADATRAVKHMDEETERARRRTEWVRALRASLTSER